MSNEVGYVTLAVIPSFKGASSALEKELSTSGIGTKAGSRVGTQYGTSFAKTSASAGKKGVSSIFANAEKGAATAGLGMGRRFGTALHESLGEYTKTIGAAVVGLFAVEKVKEFFTASINEATEAQQVGRQTAAVLASTGEAAGISADGVSTLAGALSRKVGVDDEAIQSGENLLLTFRNIKNEAGAGNDIFNQTVSTMLDVSQAMGQDTKSSAIQLGKALNDPIRGVTALTRIGVTFTDQQRDQIKALEESGRTLDAQKIILKELGTEFGGAAEAADTPIKDLQVSVGNLEESFGGKLLPVLSEGASILNDDVLPALSSTGDILHEIPGPVYEVAGAYVALRVAQTLMAKVPLSTWARTTQTSLDGVRLRLMYTREAFVKTAEGETLLTRSGRGLSTLTAGLGGVARAGAGLAGFGLLMSNIGDQTTGTGEALHGLAQTAGYAALGFSVGGPWGAAIGGGIGLVKSLGDAFHGTSVQTDEAIQSTANYTDTLNDTTAAITGNTRALVAQALEQDGALQAAQKLGIPLADVTSAVLNQGKAHDDLIAKLRDEQDYLRGNQTDWSAYAAIQTQAYGSEKSGVQDAVAAQKEFAEKHLDSLNAVNLLLGGLDGEHTKLGRDIAAKRRLIAATDKSTESTKNQTTAVDTIGTSLEEAARQTHQLYDQTLRLDNQALGIRGALSNYQASLDDLTGSIKENGHSLDVGTEKGRANRAALDAVAQSALEAESHMTKAARVKFNNEAHDKLVDLRTEFDGNRKAAEKYADRVLGKLVPVLSTASTGLDDTTTAAQNLAKQHPTVTVEADTTTARAGIDGFVRDANTSLNNIQDEPVAITLSTQATKVFDQLGGIGLKDGGAVYGPGGPRDDKIPAMLSDGERVAAAHIVNAAGKGNNRRGQAVLAGIERMILRGELGNIGDIAAFKDGGPVVIPAISPSNFGIITSQLDNAFASAAARLGGRMSSALSDKLTHLPSTGQLGPNGTLTPAQIIRGQQAATAQVGKPYIWGGVGPGGYDCSGFQSFVLNSAMGYGNPYFRRGSTGTMPWPGSAPGGGRYSIGWTPDWGDGIGHTSGNIGGLNVESYGGHGPAVGSGARSPLDPHFTGLMHYAEGGPVFKADTGGWLRPGINHVVNGTGRPEEIPDPRHAVSSKDVVVTLEKVVDRIEHLEDTLVRKGILFRGIIGAIRGIAKGEDEADRRHETRLERMGIRTR